MLTKREWFAGMIASGAHGPVTDDELPTVMASMVEIARLLAAATVALQAAWRSAGEARVALRGRG